MAEATPAGRFAHPRAGWLCPASGRILSQPELMREMATRRVVLLGETHDVAEIHRWQLHVSTCLHLLRPNMAMGFEMFPRRVQPVLDAWVEGSLDTATFLARSEWDRVWGFEAELYLPLFHFCRQQRVRMLALNCRRPLVTRVGQVGWEAIPVDERDGVTPAAPATEAYRHYLAAIIGGVAPERFAHFVRAQQCWDRAFACRIAEHLAQAPDDPLVVGVIGRGHLEYRHGTPFQLADLGIADAAVLLPTQDCDHDPASVAGIADALFRLDRPEPPQPRRSLPRETS